MGMSSRNGLSAFGDGADEHGRAFASARLFAAVRTACTPANVALATAMAFGWIALIGWTGAGPDSWQARACARLDLQPASCGAVRPAKDQSRLVPYAVADSATR